MRRAAAIGGALLVLVVICAGLWPWLAAPEVEVHVVPLQAMAEEPQSEAPGEESTEAAEADTPEKARWRREMAEALTKAADACGYDTQVRCAGAECAVLTEVSMRTGLLAALRRPNQVVQRAVSSWLDLEGPVDDCERQTQGYLRHLGHPGDLAVPGGDDPRQCWVMVPLSEPRWAMGERGHIPDACRPFFSEGPEAR